MLVIYREIVRGRFKRAEQNRAEIEAGAISAPHGPVYYWRCSYVWPAHCDEHESHCPRCPLIWAVSSYMAPPKNLPVPILFSLADAAYNCRVIIELLELVRLGVVYKVEDVGDEQKAWLGRLLWSPMLLTKVSDMETNSLTHCDGPLR